MSDISNFGDNEIVARIYEWHERRNEEPPRGYLGASIIGYECKRQLWYGFRWAMHRNFEGRLLRLFETGHLAEHRFVAELRAIGCTVHEVDPENGRQFNFKDIGGHFRGNCDGKVSGVPGGGKKVHVAEMKTHNDKSFNDLVKKKVKEAKPEHYAQMIVYMGEFGLDRALYIAVNKDTDALYTERVEFDPTEYEKLRSKAEYVIFSPSPPVKISEDPAFYKCKFCDFSPICHGDRSPQKNCRTCVHSTPEREGDGRWTCARYKCDLPIEGQLTGCMSHLPLPSVINYGEAIDAGEEWIAFRHKQKGDYFVVVTEGNLPPAEIAEHVHYIYTSAEIAAADGKALCDPEIEQMRAAFGAKITG